MWPQPSVSRAGVSVRWARFRHTAVVQYPYMLTVFLNAGNEGPRMPKNGCPKSDAGGRSHWCEATHDGSNYLFAASKSISLSPSRARMAELLNQPVGTIPAVSFI